MTQPIVDATSAEAPKGHYRIFYYLGVRRSISNPDIIISDGRRCYVGSRNNRRNNSLCPFGDSLDNQEVVQYHIVFAVVDRLMYYSYLQKTDANSKQVLQTLCDREVRTYVFFYSFYVHILISVHFSSKYKKIMEQVLYTKFLAYNVAYRCI